jgi:regulatory protein
MNGSADNPHTLTAAWQTALRILARRSHSRGELAGKLSRRGIGPETIDQVLDRCVQCAYLNDRDVAEGQIRRLSAKGYGIHHIRNVLGAKGIDAVLIQQGLDAIGSSWETDAAHTALAKKQPALNREKDPAKRRTKAYRFLASRGFSAETICAALNHKDAPLEG